MTNFVFQLDESSFSADVTSISNSKTIQSDEQLYSSDLICEGPIEGLVDKHGNLLKYVTTNDVEFAYSNVALAKGIYFNDVPVIDSDLNRFNFSSLNYGISYGQEYNNLDVTLPSTAFKYNMPLYLNNLDKQIDFFKDMGTSNYGVRLACFQVSEMAGGASVTMQSVGAPSMRTYFENADYKTHFLNKLDEARSKARIFNHRVVHRYTDRIRCNIYIENLFRINDEKDNRGDVVSNNVVLAIELKKSNSSTRLITICEIFGVVKGGQATVQIPFKINQSSINKEETILSVYAISKRVSSTDPEQSKSIGISSIVERVVDRGVFCSPFTAMVKTTVSSASFSKDPAKTFDLKLLKIKVPKNYDADSRSYDGVWKGDFDTFLRWTDNPAWIFYDLCTNTRYGGGINGITEQDINKWELYKISKYCDELLPVSMPLRRTPERFFFKPNPNPEKPVEKNIIIIDANERSLDQFKEIYPPVFNELTVNGNNQSETAASRNGGISNSIIYLYNLSNTGGEISGNNSKKIIYKVGACDAEYNITNSENPPYFYIQLINYFGSRKFFERYNSYFNSYVSELKTDLSPTNLSDTAVNNVKTVNMKKALNAADKNSESGAMEWILENAIVDTEKTISQTDGSGDVNEVKLSIWKRHIEKQVFDSSLYTKDAENGNRIKFIGSCVAHLKGEKEFLEPRFSANIYIDNQTEIIKLLNDMASIFRGITYSKNNFITATVDVNKEISYLFNNSNVKDGMFSYASGSLDGNYTVAKVFYRDKHDFFLEKVEIVEDSKLIDEYGVITKDILGFGVTSKDQARRLGLWMLATNKYENETISFTTSMQGIFLKPSDVVQIEDQYKNNVSLQGRVTSVNYVDNYVVVDRKLSLRLSGKIIKFLFINNVFDNTVEDVKDSEGASVLDKKDVFEMRIDRIENNTNRVYLDTSYVDSSGVNTADYISRIVQSCPFIIVDEIQEEKVNKLFKIISIAEEDINSYKVTCIRHDPNKYSSLDEDGTFDPKNFSDNTISFGVSNNIKELNFAGDDTLTPAVPSINAFLGGSDANYYKLQETESLTKEYDFAFKEANSSLIGYKTWTYRELIIDFSLVKSYLENQAEKFPNDINNYYYKVNKILSKRNSGFLCVLNVRNQSIRFNVDIQDIEQSGRKQVFMGRFESSINSIINPSSDIRVYLYDEQRRIIKL